MKTTILKIQLPLKRMPPIKRDQFYPFLPWRVRRFGWLFRWGGCSITEFGGKRINTVRHFQLFRFHILTIHINEYEDLSDKERAEKYMRKCIQLEQDIADLRLKMAIRNTCSSLFGN